MAHFNMCCGYIVFALGTMAMAVVDGAANELLAQEKPKAEKKPAAKHMEADLGGGIKMKLVHIEPGQLKAELAQAKEANKDFTPRWPDEIPLPEGALRLGSAALRFRDGVYGVTFLGDGQRFATINHNRVRIFATASAKEVRGWKADAYALLAIAATPDGKRIASAGNNEMIRIWDADTGKMIREFNKHVGARVFKLNFSPDGKHLVSLGSERERKQFSDDFYRSTDHGLRVWDVETGTELPAFKGGLVAGNHAEFTPDGKSLTWYDKRIGKVLVRPLAGGPDQTWDVKNKAKWGTRSAYLDSPLQPVRVSPDRSLVASAGENDGIVLWEPATGTRRTLRPGRGLYGLDFSRDGKTLIACGYDEIRLFNVATGKEHGAFGHRAGVVAVSLAVDQKSVATASHDGTVRVWDRATGAERLVFAEHKGAVTAVVFLGNKSVASAGLDGTIRIWDADTGKEQQRFHGPKNGVHSLALSPNGKLLAAGGGDGDGVIRLWDTDTWKDRKPIEGHRRRVCTLVFAPDGKSLFSASAPVPHEAGFGFGTFRMWDLDSGQEVRRFKDNPLLPVALSADGKLAMSNNDQFMIVWDTATAKQHAKIPRMDGYVRAVAFSPDGKTLALSRYAYMIEDNLLLVDTTTWKIKGKLAGHPQAINALVYSTDGRFLISGSDDGSAVVWDMNKVAMKQ